MLFIATHFFLVCLIYWVLLDHLSPRRTTRDIKAKARDIVLELGGTIDHGALVERLLRRQTQLTQVEN